MDSSPPGFGAATARAVANRKTGGGGHPSKSDGVPTERATVVIERFVCCFRSPTSSRSPRRTDVRPATRSATQVEKAGVNSLLSSFSRVNSRSAAVVAGHDTYADRRGSAAPPPRNRADAGRHYQSPALPKRRRACGSKLRCQSRWLVSEPTSVTRKPPITGGSFASNTMADALACSAENESRHR